MSKKLQSRAEVILEPFREENLSKWLSYPIEDFLRTIVHEFAVEEKHIEAWVNLVRKNNSNLDQIVLLSKGEDVVTLDDLLDKFMSSSEIIRGLLGCIKLYLRAKHTQDEQPSS